MDYRNIPNKQEKYAWNFVESRLHKVENRPITRFQIEALPPKLAKSSPVTHHKLLSPIKNLRFTLTKNVAYIMEAAAKIIEASPKASSIGRNPINRYFFSSLENSGFETENESCTFNIQAPKIKKRHSDSLRNKGKSVPIAAQAKSNARRRARSTSRSKSIVKQKEQNEVKANQLLKNQHCTQNAIQKRTFESRTTNVLQQNNLKQNSVPNKGSSTFEEFSV
ncbi:hypothetical protein OIU78_027842 [Salix suchowensis]|nr:hypothetical protein OIU78_027842 [Salix suchowensis]